MSLVTAIHVPYGIAMSADSRATATLRQVRHEEGRERVIESKYVHTDASEKLFLLDDWLGLGVFGELMVRDRPVDAWVRVFEREHLAGLRGNAEAAAQHLLHFFGGLHGDGGVASTGVNFILCAYQGTEPYVWSVTVGEGRCMCHNRGAEGRVTYGAVRGGDTDIVDRLLANGAMNPKFDVMALQDAVDFSRHLVGVTIAHSAFEPRLSTVGGAVDTLVLRPGGGDWVVRKGITA